ncbi:hypothetical protein [Paenibacillus woosongensis]|uniref:hypothetical protein n=1 Tax=Paenibacillus woosongensis TaxID=307580 RepID=UPI0018C29AE4|nr:hypothetical protein [Paenibacillus woosongensis]
MMDHRIKNLHRIGTERPYLYEQEPNYKVTELSAAIRAILGEKQVVCINNAIEFR